MRLLNHILIYLLFFLCSVGFSPWVDAAPPGKTAVGEESQTPGETAAGPSPIQEHHIALPPFYYLQSNGSQVWVERILVTFTMAAPQNGFKHDLDSPTFRKLFYELLQSGESDATIQAQAVTHLKGQGEMQVDPAVQISRSVLIVR
jgi:hypothetical protein